ncbi:TetR/AcrR family transcriptional regulator [uncultured Abyssibacter sp.]|uniref:TetR/AcrR family transcriptional regulator n=1 Tax=uncultured Abyssibacter sp. TaxID=2320202 RepID=UPI0032B12869
MARKIFQPHLSTASDPRAVRTREALRNALLELLEDTPLEQISIRDIAARAAVGYTTYFRHYPDKESLLNEVAAEEIGNLVELSVPMMSGSDTRQATMTLCRYVDEHRALWATLLTGGAAAALRQEFLRLCRKIAMSNTWPDSWLPAEVGVNLAVSGTIELLAWWLRQDDPVPMEQVAGILDRVIVSPLVRAGQEERPPF